MARGFLSDGGGRPSRGDEEVTVDLELGWSTDKAFGFRDPFDKDKSKHLVGGSKEKLIWIPKSWRGVSWEGPEPSGHGKLTASQRTLEEKGLV
jgi:hypothetical protein